MGIPCQIPILDTDNVLLCRFSEISWSDNLERELKSPAAHLPWFMEGKNAYLLSKCDPLWRKRRAKLNKVLEFHWKKKSVHNSTIDSVTAECRGSNDLFTFFRNFFLGREIKRDFWQFKFSWDFLSLIPTPVSERRKSSILSRTLKGFTDSPIRSKAMKSKRKVHSWEQTFMFFPLRLSTPLAKLLIQLILFCLYYCFAILILI